MNRRKGIFLGPAILLSGFGLAGCRQTQQPSPAPLPEPTKIGRFQLVSGATYAIALDTKTGELCHTFNQELDPYIPGRGYDSNRDIVPGHPSLFSIPLCIDLSQNEERTVKNELLSNQAQRSVDEAEGKK